MLIINILDHLITKYRYYKYRKVYKVHSATLIFAYMLTKVQVNNADNNHFRSTQYICYKYGNECYTLFFFSQKNVGGNMPSGIPNGI